MQKRLPVLIATLLLLPGLFCSADERPMPKKPATQCLKVTFNNETISAYYLLIDARSDLEKQADKARGVLNGSVLIFFQGHGQRPGDAYKFTSKLAAGSRSGIVLVPVVDTPYGRDAAWRGDRGKDAVLMEMVRYVLSGQGMTVDGYQPLTDLPVAIEGKPVVATEEGIVVKLAAIGWSHGGILSRRMASAYPQTFTGLGQVCPAGYKKWACSGALIGRFAWEGLHISTLAFRGHAIDTLGCGWGLTRGVTGDLCRSVPKAVIDLQPSKLGRSWRDIKDCCQYCDDTHFPLNSIHNIVVIFGRDDTCMRARDYGLNGPEGVTPKEASAFWNTYYPGALAAGARLDVRVLPGMHVGPVTESEAYARAILAGIDQGLVSAAEPNTVKP